jgi:hypothetical protein
MNTLPTRRARTAFIFALLLAILGACSSSSPTATLVPTLDLPGTSTAMQMTRDALHLTGVAQATGTRASTGTPASRTIVTTRPARTPTPRATSLLESTATQAATPTCTLLPKPTLAATQPPTLTAAQTQPPPPNLLVYPYLGETTPTSVVISWATDGAGVSEVRYSLDQSYGNVVAAASSIYDDKYWHAATIGDLMAHATYYYRVYTNGSDLTPWSGITFTTAPEPSVPRFTFVVLGDSRPGSGTSPPTQAALDIASELDAHSFDLALHMGDIVNSGGECSGDGSVWNQYLRAYFDVYRRSMGAVPFFPSIGNHELAGGTCGYQGYTDVYSLPENAPPGDEEEYYSFDWGNAHFVALDTNQSYSAGSTQYDWLVADLQTSTQPWKFVFFHHPPFSSGYHGSTSGVQTHLVPLFEAYGVDAVFCGHDHHYERTCPIANGACTTPQGGGVVYYVTGGAGAALYGVSSDWFTAYSASVHHFLKVEVNDCWLRVDAIDSSGFVFDSFEVGYCDAAPPHDEIRQCRAHDVFLKLSYS